MNGWTTGPRCRVVGTDTGASPALPSGFDSSRQRPLRMVLEYASAKDFLEDYTANAMLGGTFVRTDRPLAAGVRVALLIVVVGATEPIHTMATVDWAIHPGDADYLAPGMGLHFEIMAHPLLD